MPPTAARKTTGALKTTGPLKTTGALKTRSAPATQQAPTVSPSVDAPAASARQLTVTHGVGETTVLALRGVDVDIRAGEFTAVMGPSGSGKSTLMHCLAGLDTPTSGTITLGGVTLSDLNDTALTRVRRTHVGFVFQAFNLIPTMTAHDNIMLPLRLAGVVPDRAWWDTVINTLGLAERLQHRPTELSGGQQQRVAMARALLPRPSVIFADEPTGALDSATGVELLEFLRTSVHEWGQTVVMVTHDPAAASYADRVLILEDGRIMADLQRPDADVLAVALRRRGGAA